MSRRRDRSAFEYRRRYGLAARRRAKLLRATRCPCCRIELHPGQLPEHLRTTHNTEEGPE